MEVEKIEYKYGDGKSYRTSSHISREDHDLDVRSSRSKKDESYIRRSLQVRDVNRRDGKRKVKKIKEHPFDSEVGDIGSVELASSIVNENDGLVSLKYYKEMEEKLSLALKEKDLLINSLMKDIRMAEDENTKCKAKLLELKEKFKVATDEMVLAEEAHTKLSEKYKVLQEQYEALKLKDRSSNKQVIELMNNIKYLEDVLNNQENKPEKELEECWKIVKAKEKEIEELEIKLQKTGDYLSHSDTSEILIYQKQLFEKNEKIKDLENKLQDAVMEIEESSKTLLLLKSERSHSNSEMALTGFSHNEDYLSKTEEKHLKKQLETLNHKLSLATEKLRRFEQNEYGLPEALAEVKELKRQVYMRDLNIADLVSKINSYSADPENFVAKRHGIEADYHKPKRKKTKRVDTKYLFEKCLANKAIYRGKLPEYFTNEEVINKLIKWAKTQRIFHQASKEFQGKFGFNQTTQRAPESERGTPSSKISSFHQEDGVGKPILNEELPVEIDAKEEKEDGEVGSRLEEMIIENDCLRKGMHEILDSIRTQDGEYYASIKRIHLLALHFASSDVKLESRSLEQLLQALDQRHVSGWYHPAMRLEAQLQSTEGVNAALREQIRSTRLEEKKTKEKLQIALSRLNSFENELVNGDSVNLPQSIHSVSSETLDLARHIKYISNELNEIHTEQNIHIKLKEDLQTFNDRFIVLYQKLSVFYQRHMDEKLNWEKEREELTFNLEKTKAAVDPSEPNTKAVGAEIINNQIDNSTEKNEVLKDQKEVIATDELAKIESCKESMKRKCYALENFVDNLKREKERLQMDMQELKIIIIQKEENNIRQNEISHQQITSLKRQLDECVPQSSMEETTKQLNELIIKYRAVLQKDEFSIVNDMMLSEIQEELRSLKKDKQELQKELVSARKKLHQFGKISGDQISSDQGQEDEIENKVSTPSEKLAILEVGEITARQNLSHCEQMCETYKSQLAQLQETNAELQVRCSSLKQKNHDLQLIEMNLQDQLNNFVGLSGAPGMSQQFQDAELRLCELQEDNLKLKTRAEIAEEQVQSLQLLKSTQDSETKSLRQKIADLQSDNEDKAVIAKISDELLHVQNLLAISNEKNRLMELQTGNLNDENSKMKQMLHEKDLENFNNKNIMTRYCRQLLRYILEMRIRYGGAFTLQMQEKMHHNYLLLQKEHSEVKLRARKMEDALLASLNSSVTDESVSKDSEEKDFKVLQLISSLKDQVKAGEDKINKLKEYISKLESENSQIEKEYEFNKSQWENREYELLKELGHHFSVEPIQDNRAFENITDEPTSMLADFNEEKAPQPPSPEKKLLQECKGQEIHAVEKCPHNEEIVAQQNVIKELIEQLAKVEFELNEKEIDLKELQGIMSFHTNCQLAKKCNDNTLKNETHAQLSKGPRMREFNFAYKVTMDALNVMLNQKEEVLSRYKKLVMETREAHAKTLHDLNVKQNLSLTEKSSDHQDISMGVLKTYRPLQEQIVQTPVSTEIPCYTNKIEELQNEITLLQRKSDYLAVQLNIWESEAHQYKALADKRQVEMEELLNRLEMQQKSWFDGSCNATSNTPKNDVVSEIKDLLIETVKKEHLPIDTMVTVDSSIPKKTVMDIGINTDITSQRVDVENGESKHIKRKTEKINGFSLSKEDAEDIDQELETISNLIDKAEEGSDEKNSGKAMSGRKIVHRLRLKDVTSRKSIGTTSEMKTEKLKDDIKMLEEQLHNCQLQLEAVQKDAEIDTKKKVELARWGESKKWQHTVDKLQERLRSDKASTENLKKMNTSLKDAVVRLQREKSILECKAKNAITTKELETTWSLGSEKRIEALQKRISNLEKTISDLEALNIAQKHKLDKYETKMKNVDKERLEQKNKNNYEDEGKEELSGEDILFEIKMLKEERENLLKENAKAFSKINNLEEEIKILKDLKLSLEKKILVFLGKEETASMIHNEVNALRVELARKTKILRDVKGVLIRVREKTKNKKQLHVNTI